VTQTGQDVSQGVEAPQLKILIVDDDQTNRLVLEAILKKYGYQILATEDGRRAVELYTEHLPDLVLMDVMMPVMNGYEATREIKALSNGRFTPIIFLTALSDENALADCVSCGGDDFLTKPYNHVILKAKIDALLRMRSLYAEIKLQKDELGYHHERLSREHEIAERVFANVIKPVSREIPNVKHRLSPMSMANGDMLLVAKKTPTDFHYLLGDFTGHGLSAAIGALPVSEIFYTMTRKGFHISDIVTEINRKLKQILPTGIFFCACLIEYEVKKGTVSVWNGGIPEVLVCSDDGGVRKFSSKHLPIGVLGDEQFDRTMDRFGVADGDRIYVYSDGLIEANNSQQEMFGEERLERVLIGDVVPEQRFELLNREIDLFCGGAEQSDDLTLLEIHCAAENESQPNMSVADLRRSADGASEWRFVIELGATALRMLDPKPMLTQLLVDIEGLEEHRERLYMVLAELYSNSLEHGLLRLDSRLKQSENGFEAYYMAREKALNDLDDGWMKIGISHQPDDEGGRLTLRVEDSGNGFDLGDSSPNLEQNTTFSGRGISLVKNLCSQLTYHGNGSCVEAVYKW